MVYKGNYGGAYQKKKKKKREGTMAVAERTFSALNLH